MPEVFGRQRSPLGLLLLLAPFLLLAGQFVALRRRQRIDARRQKTVEEVRNRGRQVNRLDRLRVFHENVLDCARYKLGDCDRVRVLQLRDLREHVRDPAKVSVGCMRTVSNLISRE